MARADDSFSSIETETMKTAELIPICEELKQKVKFTDDCQALNRSELRLVVKNAIETYQAQIMDQKNKDESAADKSKKIEEVNGYITSLNKATTYMNYIEICDSIKVAFPNDPNCTMPADCEDSSIKEINTIANQCIGTKTSQLSSISTKCSDWFTKGPVTNQYGRHSLTMHYNISFVTELYKGSTKKMPNLNGKYSAAADISYDINESPNKLSVTDSEMYTLSKVLEIIKPKSNQSSEAVFFSEEWLTGCFNEIMGEDFETLKKQNQKEKK